MAKKIKAQRRLFLIMRTSAPLSFLPPIPLKGG